MRAFTQQVIRIVYLQFIWDTDVNLEAYIPVAKEFARTCLKFILEYFFHDHYRENFLIQVHLVLSGTCDVIKTCVVFWKLSTACLNVTLDCSGRQERTRIHRLLIRPIYFDIFSRF